mgnify:CR=1 FL=1
MRRSSTSRTAPSSSRCGAARCGGWASSFDGTGSQPVYFDDGHHFEIWLTANMTGQLAEGGDVEDAASESHRDDASDERERSSVAGHVVTIGSVAPALFALLQFPSPWQGVAIFAGIQVVAFFIGNLIYPRMQADTQNLDPVVTLLALAFWTFLWGLPGAFLAVPMTLMLMMVFAQFDGTLTADFGAHSTSWQFQKGGYVNTDSYAAQGDQFPADSILVLRVRVGDAGYRDPAGYPVPETKLEGKGAALLFHGGRVIRGTWSKDGLKGPIELSTKRGELTVPAGHVWVELVPAANGNVTFAK